MNNLELFIKKANEVHNYKYDYSKSIYTKASEKLIIICKIHGEFNQTPANHVKDHGCKKCGTEIIKQKQTISQEDFINRVNEKWPNLLDLSKTVYTNFKTKLTVKCKKCNTEYDTDASQLLCRTGHGCVVCNGGGKHNKELFVTKSIQLHGNKYNYELVEYKNAITKVKIKCKHNHIFEQMPNHHLTGNGCPKCIGKYKTQDEFIELSKNKYGNLFDYSKLNYINMKTLITLICNEKHTFKVTPASHLGKESSGGCKECQKKNISEKNSYSQEEWISLSKKKHNNIYNYSKVNYISSSTEVIIVCSKHGDFIQLPVSHLGGSGCSQCGFEKLSKSKMLSGDELNEKITTANIIHNKKYNYLEIYRDNGILHIKAICDKHGIFNQRLGHHLNGHGCSKCIIQYSKQQIACLKYFEISMGFIQHAENIGEFKIPDTTYWADGYSNKLNIIIEFHGDYWHGNPEIFNKNDINTRTSTTFGELYDKTMKKTSILRDKGYNVYEIWENNWKKGIKAIKVLQNKFRNKSN